MARRVGLAYLQLKRLNHLLLILFNCRPHNRGNLFLFSSLRNLLLSLIPSP